MVNKNDVAGAQSLIFDSQRDAYVTYCAALELLKARGHSEEEAMLILQEAKENSQAEIEASEPIQRKIARLQKEAKAIANDPIVEMLFGGGQNG